MGVEGRQRKYGIFGPQGLLVYGYIGPAEVFVSWGSVFVCSIERISSIQYPTILFWGDGIVWPSILLDGEGHGNPRFPHSKGLWLTTHIFLGIKTFIFPCALGVQGRVWILGEFKRWSPNHPSFVSFLRRICHQHLDWWWKAWLECFPLPKFNMELQNIYLENGTLE